MVALMKRMNENGGEYRMANEGGGCISLQRQRQCVSAINENSTASRSNDVHNAKIMSCRLHWGSVTGERINHGVTVVGAIITGGV